MRSGGTTTSCTGRFFAYRADEEELPSSVGALCSHHATKHIEQNGFSLILSYTCRLVFLNHAGFKIDS